MNDKLIFPLGDLGTLTSSKRIFKKEYVKEGIPFYRSKEIKELAHNKEISLELFITKDRYTEIKSKFGVPQKGDILLTAVGTIGEMYIVEENDEFYFKDGNIMWLKDFESLDSYYLKYQLTLFIENIKSLAQGSAYSALTIEKLKKYKILVPPLPEQTQIVITLDKAFKQIDQAKVNLEKNLNNAKELFQSKLNEVFSQRGEGWEEKTLNDTCIVERGSSPRPIKSFITEDEDGVNWIKIGDTKGIEKYIYKTNQKITKKGAEKSRFVDVGDFILSNSMSFGRPYIMKTQGYIHDGWFVFRLPENIDAEFFWYLLVSPNIKEQFHGLASGAIVKNISGDLVKKTILHIPSIIIQKEIVKQLDKFSQLSKELQTHYQHKLNNLEELKKSILQKAFRGEL